MRWIVLVKLPLEYLKSDTASNWAMDPTFYRGDWSDEDKLFWTVSLLHLHWDNPLNPGNSPPDMFHCGLVNRDETLRHGVFPKFECDKCGKEVPKNVVEEKIERHRSLKGVDPRNNRRGAVLATRVSNLTDTKES